MSKKTKMKNKKNKGGDLPKAEKEVDEELPGDEEPDEGFDDIEEENY